jgi:predicted  nucleic acid-binding Zn-ribbon protein
MILVMNKKMTLDVLAGMIQAGFSEITADLKALTLHVDALEKRMNGFEKRMDSLEERMENGFYNIAQELQQIRKQIAETVTRKEFRALEVRVDVIEKRLS